MLRGITLVAAEQHGWGRPGDTPSFALEKGSEVMAAAALRDGNAAIETHWDRRRRVIALEIEKIALRAFAEHGYENVTVEDIANASGVTVRTFYRYFTGKEDVMAALPRRVQAKLAAALKRRPRTESIIESYRQVIAQRSESSPEDEEISKRWGDIFAKSKQLPTTALYQSTMPPVVTLVAERLGVDENADPRPRLLAGAIAGVLDASLAVWLADGGTGDRAALMLEALDLLEQIGSLGAEPEARPTR